MKPKLLRLLMQTASSVSWRFSRRELSIHMPRFLTKLKSVTRKPKRPWRRVTDTYDVCILQAQAELAGAMQGPGESVVEFADRIRLLGRAAYPHADESDESSQMNLASRFWCGLHDERLQSQLCGEDAHTLQALVDKACALHKRQAAVSAMRRATAGVRSVAAAAQAAAQPGLCNGRGTAK